MPSDFYMYCPNIFGYVFCLGHVNNRHSILVLVVLHAVACGMIIDLRETLYHTTGAYLTINYIGRPIVYMRLKASEVGWNCPDASLVLLDQQCFQALFLYARALVCCQEAQLCMSHIKCFDIFFKLLAGGCFFTSCCQASFEETFNLKKCSLCL